jgi:predicted ATPase
MFMFESSQASDIPPSAPAGTAGTAVLQALRTHAGQALSEERLLALAPSLGGPAQLYDLIVDINRAVLAPAADGSCIIRDARGEYTFRLRAFPWPAKRLIGCDAAVEAIGAKLLAHRFVSIVGPGGIGKSSVARVVAARFADDCILLDLAPLSDPALLASTVAAALGMPFSPAAGTGDGVLKGAPLAALLRGRDMLVVFDCCEHLADAAARAVEALLAAGPGVRVLATSREPLRAAGEHLYRLAPMALPPSTPATAGAALASPAVQLFAGHAFPDGLLRDADAGTVAALCADLDGLPLAIELAAALVAPLGLQAVARQVTGLLLPVMAASGAAGRHLDLRAMLDWSYHLLAPDEQTVFRRLAVFRAPFTLDAAAAVAGTGFEREDAIETVIGLMGKSLVCAGTVDADGIGRHRLLSTTRAYAQDKLAACPDAPRIYRQHAVFLCAMLEEAHATWQTVPRRTWLGRYGGWLDDIRAALDWAFGPSGDAALGLALTALSYPLAGQAGATLEFTQRVGKALAVAATMDDGCALLRLQLTSYHELCQTVQSDEDIPGMLAQKDASVRAAAALGNAYLQAVPLTQMWGVPFVAGDYPAALAASERIRAVAADLDDPVLALIGERIRAQTRHFTGDQAAATDAAHRALADCGRRIPLVYSPTSVDISVSMRIMLARILWLQGKPSEARAMCDEALALAAQERTAALCQAICVAAIPLALWDRDVEACRGLLAALEQHAARYSLRLWLDWGEGFRAIAAALAAPAADCRVAVALAARGDRKFNDHLATFDPALLLPAAVERVERGQVGWCAPEVLRAQALRLQAGGAAAAAEHTLHRAIALAREQGALAWELRAATSLARLLAPQGRHDEARRALGGTIARWPGADTSADLNAARRAYADCDG